MDIEGRPAIRTDNPSLAFANVASLIVEENTCVQQGVHKTAIVDKQAKLGKNVSIGA